MPWEVLAEVELALMVQEHELGDYWIVDQNDLVPILHYPRWLFCARLR